MTADRDLFPGFASHRVDVAGLEIFARVGGSGPPLLLIHGYPQTHVCWHAIAPDLAKRFTLVIADMTGYGASAVPPTAAGTAAFSKRTMAATMHELMRQLGYARFAVMGHDRGARIAYRLALDHPLAISALLPLDIIPTSEMWARITAERAIGSYHWQFLAQPAPLPETLIGADPAFYVRHTLASWTRTKDLTPFAPVALETYSDMLDAPDRVRAVCEDYRAGATIDREIDLADRTSGRRIACPTFIVWGSDYLGRGKVGPLEAWQPWCTSLDGREITSGHFLAEENPLDLLAAINPFLAAHTA